ncbi:amidohydrolase [bacterium]|nr:amidohydrolase [bacterium]
MSILIKNVILNGKRRDILIEGNKIEKIGKSLNLRADEKIDGKEQKAVLPGLINCHGHSAMTLFRGYADDLPLKEWLEKKIWPLEAKLNREDVYWGTKLACLEMIKTGTTCFNDMYWSEEASVEAAEEMGIRAKIGLVVLDFLPMGKRENIEKYWNIFKRKKFKTVTFSIAPHSIYTVSKESLVWAKNFAKKNNLLLHIHLSETEKEVKDCQKKYRLRPVEYLNKIGFLNQDCILAHSIWLSEKEIKILTQRRCNVVYNPCSNMKLASGIFPYKKIRKAGINICLGTDGPASNNNLDLFEEMKFGALLQKVKEKDPTVASASEIFEIATKNGAKALRINAGEIRVGKLADLILIDLNQVCLIPGHNLISDIVYSCSGTCVSDVIVNGKVLMRDRKVKGEGKIKREIAIRAKGYA